MNLNKIGSEMANLLDMFGNEHPEEDVVAGSVLIVVEFQDDENSWISYRCSDRRPWIQRAMLTEALDLATEPPDKITEDDE